MKITCYYFFVLLALTIVTSCNSKESADTLRYFSLDRFFKDEALKLRSSGPLSLRKTIQQGDHIETLTDSLPDWNRELAVFASMDINKPVNRDAYDIDTTPTLNDYRHILIEAKDYQKSRVQLIDILYNNHNTVEMITVHYHNSSSMQETDYQLNYLPGKGYDLSGTSKTPGSSEPHDFDVHAEIVRPGLF